MRDYGLRYASPVASPSDYDFTPAAQLCITTAKLGPPMYVATKACSYMFFFLKARTAVPKEKMGWMHKGLLFVTLQMFTFAACAAWLVTGDWVKLDATCNFWAPPWMLVLMGCADAMLSAVYCVMFIAPLRETIKANRAMRSGAARVAPVVRIKVTPADAATVTAAATDAGSQALAAASARGSALETVMRRNLRSCVLSILSTTASMSFVMASHLIDDQHMRKLTWVVGTVDLGVTCLSIAHLMHKSSPTNVAAGVNGATQKAGAGAPPPTVVGPASKAHSSDKGGIASALGRPAGGGDNATTTQHPRGSASPPTASSSPPLALTVLATVSPVGPHPESDAPSPMHNRYMVSSPSSHEPASPSAALPHRSDVVLEMQQLPSPQMDALPRAALRME